MGRGMAVMGVPGLLDGGGDTIAPTCVITSAADAYVFAAFSVTFTFYNGETGIPEDVTGFAIGDITVGNGAAGSFVAVSGSVYTATITPTAMGTATVDVGAGVCTDGAGNPNEAATQLTRTYIKPALWARGDLGVFTDAAKTTPATNGQAVYTWVDQISGADLIQATEANRPVLLTVGINSLPSLSFNATHWLTSTFDANNGYTAVYILYTADGTAEKYLSCANAATNNFLHVRGTESVRMDAGTTITPVNNGGYPLSTAVCLLAEFNGVASNIEINGTAGTAGDAGTTALTNLRVGCYNGTTSGWIGLVGEVMYFTEILSAGNKAILESYLAARWGMSFN